MGSTFGLLESAALGIEEFDGLERRLKAKGVNVQDSRKFTIVADDQELEVSYDGAKVVIKMERAPSIPFLVKIPDLLRRTQELLGEAPVRAYIDIGSGVVYAQGVREVLDRQIIDDRKISHGHSEFTYDDARSADMSYISRKLEFPLDKPRILSSGLKQAQEVKDMLVSKYRGTLVPSENYLILELDEPLRSFGDFVKLTEDVASELNVGRHFVASTEVEIPLSELRFQKAPPILAITSNKPYRMHYACEPPHFPFDYRQNAVHELRRLRLEIPFNELAKVAEFYDGLRVRMQTLFPL